MKTFILAVILAVVTIAGGVLFNMQIDSAALVMEGREKLISSHISQESFDEALSEIEELSKYIDEKRTVLASAIDHQIIDDIELCVSELRGCAEQKSASLALIKCRRLEHLIAHLPTNYSLALQNIL